jgi:hypothetical protein
MGSALIGAGGLPSELFAGRRADASATDTTHLDRGTPRRSAAAGTVPTDQCVECGSSGGGGGGGGSGGFALLAAPLRFDVRLGAVDRGSGGAYEHTVNWVVTRAAALDTHMPADGNAAPPSRAEVARWSAELSSSGADGLSMSVVGEWWFDAQAVVTLTLRASQRVRVSQSELPWLT